MDVSVDDPSYRGPRLKVSLKFRERDDVPGLAQLIGFVALDAPMLKWPSNEPLGASVGETGVPAAAFKQSAGRAGASWARAPLAV